MDHSELSIKGAVFDVDGFVVDTMPDLVDAFQQATFDKAGVEIDREFLYSLAGMNAPAIMKRFLAEYGDDFPLKEIRERQQELVWKEWERGEIHLKSGVEEVLDLFDDLKVPIAAGSGGSHENTRRKLELTGVLDHFQAIVGGDEVGNGKPNPETFLLAKERLEEVGALEMKTPSHRVLAGGDNNVDVLAANDANMYSIYIPDSGRFSEVAASAAHFVFNCFTEAAEHLRDFLRSR